VDLLVFRKRKLKTVKLKSAKISFQFYLPQRLTTVLTMQRLCISLCVALSCLLAFSVGQDDVFRRDQLIVYRIGDSNSKSGEQQTVL
jgi:hypothetical protein